MIHLRKRSALALLVTAILVRPAHADVCTEAEGGKVSCTIETLADCELIRDFPYARNLHCPAAYQAAERMAGVLARTLGVAGPTRAAFTFYQSLPDPTAPPADQPQTTIPCLETPFPGGSSVVVGAGVPLCHLLAFATSPGPVGPETAPSAENPVPPLLHGFQRYFQELYDPIPSHALLRFRTGSVYDAVVDRLGAAGLDGFLADVPDFSADDVYDPAGWSADPGYHGIGGGGGGGWGGDIGVLADDGALDVWLTFGGGGGGGLTSLRTPEVGGSSHPGRTQVGAGGGGGVQFGPGYRSFQRPYDGLGLGAGSSSDGEDVLYSYVDFAGSKRPPQPEGRYNPLVVHEYRQQIKNLHYELRRRLQRGDTVVLSGGGGMGGGTEYLDASGEKILPLALSTQGGFRFRFEFDTASEAAFLGEPPVDRDAEEVYELLGDDFKVATQRAYEACGRDYSNYDCICPKMHATVLCLLGQQLGDSERIPGWLRQPHCPVPEPDFTPVASDDEPAAPSGYHRLLLDAAGDLEEGACQAIVREYLSE